MLATAMPALMQSALPLELVRGGLRRPPLPEAGGALLIGLQLVLLLLLQWPVGQRLARRPVAHGLGLSLLSFATGNLLLAGSAFSGAGLWWIVLAQVPLALGQAAFLPIATEAVVELTPPEHQGLALALFSQCFAVSSLVAPLLAGEVLERQGHGTVLWLGMALGCAIGWWWCGAYAPAVPLSCSEGAASPEGPRRASGAGATQASWGRGSVPYSQSS